MGRLLEYDSETGITEIFHKTDKGFAIEMKQDVSYVLKSNAEARSAPRESYIKSGKVFHHIADIPLVLIQQWRDELKPRVRAGLAKCTNPLHPSNKEWFRAKINSRDFYKIRTNEGKV